MLKHTLLPPHSKSLHKFMPMHIREVVMDGFKCYVDKTTLRNIDRSFTAITGMNGSGKSNIVDAIIFALDLGTSKRMRAASLKELINIHRKECTVTIVFDNMDKSVSPSGYETNDLIEISRSLDSEGKSKYRMNNHNCTKSTVESFCKSMGITDDFIVMQGHITKMLSMRNMELKNMVEETAGTKNYSIEREKSLELFQRKELKLKEAQKHLKRTISPFFAQLKKEKEVYEENRDLERNRRSFVSELRELEKTCRRNELFLRIDELEKALEAYHRDSIELKGTEEQLSEAGNLEHTDLLDLQSRISAEKSKIEEINALDHQDILSQKEKELAHLQARLQENQKFNKRELMEKESILSKELLSGFEVDKITELENTRDLCNRKEAELRLLVQDMPPVEHDHAAMQEIEENIKKVREYEERCSYLRSRIIYPIMDGVYGTVDENFDLVDTRYKEAVLTILGGRAKFIICRDDDVASEVLRTSDRKVSCIPLNKISVPSPTQVPYRATNALHAIRYNKRYERAYKHIFSGFYIFEDKAEARRCCFECKVMCVTLDGTVYDPKGTLTGGKLLNKHDTTRMSDILQLEQELSALKARIPAPDALSKLRDLERLFNKKQKLEEEVGCLRSKLGLLESLCSSKLDVKKELENVRKLIVEATMEEKSRSSVEVKLDRVGKEVEELKQGLRQNQKVVAESMRKLAELQELLRASEMREHSRKASSRMVESLDSKKKSLIKSTVKLSSRISRMWDEIEPLRNEFCQPDDEIIFNSDAFNSSMVPVNKHFNIDDRVFKMERRVLSKEEKDAIEKRMRFLEEKVNTKRALNTMDPSNFELLEKNAVAIQALEEKIQKLERDKLEIVRSIEKLNAMEAKENKRAFDHINSTLRRFLAYFFDNSDIYMTPEFELKVKIGSWKNSLSELSGGQRSLIALCLIFSMLTFKPAPFYVFDEIDAALDLNYTQSIGEIIKREFGGAQFIVVSLKNNMFDCANKVFKVFVQEHKSKICQVK